MNGGTGNGAYAENIVGWWSTDLGRIVKWQSTYSYPNGVLDNTYTNTYSQDLTSLQ